MLRGNRRIPPLFEPGLWNNYNRVLQDLPRTTNAVEGFHSSFLKSCDGLHLNFFTYLEKLQQENNKHEMNITQRIAGIPPPPRKRKYMDVDRRLKTLVERYSGNQNSTPNDLQGLVRSIAYNMSF